MPSRVLAEEQVQHAAQQHGADDDRDVVLAEDEAAEVDRAVGERRVEADRIVAPGDPGGGAEDEAEAEGQHHHGELRLADHAAQDDGVERETEGGGEQDGDAARRPSS